MQVALLNHINSLVSGNDRLVEMYRSIYYLLPAKEENLSRNILYLKDKREELALDLKKCSFWLRNSRNDKQFSRNALLRFMPALLNLEHRASLMFKETSQNVIYLEERKYLKKFFEILYNENLADGVLELLLKYKRRHKSTY